MLFEDCRFIYFHSEMKSAFLASKGLLRLNDKDNKIKSKLVFNSTSHSFAAFTRALYRRLKKNDKWWQPFFFYFFLSTVFTLVISAISHLKEDKISFSEKIYFASKNPWILNHAKKMAYHLQKLSYNFWLWNSLGLNGLELQGNISR